MLDREEDQNRAMAIAEPILAGLYGVLKESVSFYFSEAYSNEARADHTGRAVANCIYSHAEKRVAVLAEATEGLSVIDVRSMRVANYKDQGLFRFKLVKPNGRHSNYQTKQQRNYDDQKSFPEFPQPAVRLTVGYELDEAGAGLKGIMIARPIGRSVFWTAQVVMDAGVALWEDTTPARFGATEAIDFDAEKVRNRRRG
ncbi:hypothetical protein [Bradyrhizobium sp. HKCCYLS20291]|uniref:hypothetical protein n=1 Tax=Bradyrhizobium sp. HKCCYLS20291 TaxID=3420766 RepID=UPI003EBD7DEE